MTRKFFEELNNRSQFDGWHAVLTRAFGQDFLTGKAETKLMHLVK